MEARWSSAVRSAGSDILQVEWLWGSSRKRVEEALLGCEVEKLFDSTLQPRLHVTTQLNVNPADVKGTVRVRFRCHRKFHVVSREFHLVSHTTTREYNLITSFLNHLDQVGTGDKLFHLYAPHEHTCLA